MDATTRRDAVLAAALEVGRGDRHCTCSSPMANGCTTCDALDKLEAAVEAYDKKPEGDLEQVKAMLTRGDIRFTEREQNDITFLSIDEGGRVWVVAGFVDGTLKTLEGDCW